MQMTRRTGMIAALAALVSAGLPAMASDKAELSGTITYRERIALPPDAVAEIQLVDVSRADAPAEVLGEVRIEPVGQVPIPFKLTYDPSAIQSGHRYALQARIRQDGKLLFTTDSHWPVFEGGAEKTDLLLRRVGSDSQDSAQGLAGTWLAEDIGAGGVIDNLQTTLDIRPDGAFSGNGGCNGYKGMASISGDAIRFGPAAATFKACTTAVMEQERKFHVALGKVRSWETDTVRGKLILKSEAGEKLIGLARR